MRVGTRICVLYIYIYIYHVTGSCIEKLGCKRGCTPKTAARVPSRVYTVEYFNPPPHSLLEVSVILKTAKTQCTLINTNESSKVISGVRMCVCAQM